MNAPRFFPALAFGLALARSVHAAENRAEYEFDEKELAAHPGTALAKVSGAAALMALSGRKPAPIRIAERRLEAAKLARRTQENVTIVSARTETLTLVQIELANARHELKKVLDRRADWPAEVGDKMQTEAETKISRAQQKLQEVAAMEFPEHRQVATRILEDRALIAQRARELQRAVVEHAPGLGSLGVRAIGRLSAGILIYDAALEVSYLVRGESEFFPLYYYLTAPRPVRAGEITSQQ